MKHEIALNGCAPTPLAHYLKALGILRLVAEQKDSEVTGFWKNESFVIKTTLDKDALLRFFLEEYRPTPIIAPWNGGSGFYFQEGKTKEKDPLTGKKLKTGVRNQATEATKTIDAFANSHAQRFTEFRQLIEKSRQTVNQCGLQEAPKNEDKAKFLQIVRNVFPDEFLAWMDAALVLSQDRAFFPPVLGTGGNDGNLDFTNNFMQRIRQLFNLEDGSAYDDTASWLDGTLFEQATTRLLKEAAIGQFFPGGAGGPNATAGFEYGSIINPWDFVFMIEGALLLAATTSRRLQQDSAGALSYPFTVRTTGSGSGSNNQADEANARAEIWLPLWRNASTLAELKVLFQEGRATVGRRPAKDGLDFARAVSALGVDRGISEFQRYGFVMRSGKAYLATPFGRIQTRRNPAADLMQNLDKNRFLDNLRSFAGKAEAPGRIAALARQMENRLFELTRRDNPRTIQDILILLGRLQRVLSISPKGREAVRLPVPPLAPEWVWKADDGSTEFRLACALASLTAPSLPIRVHFSPIDAKKHDWDKESRLAVWKEGAFERNMTALLRSRLLAAERMLLKDKPFDFHFGANSSDIAAYLDNTLDDPRIGDLAQGLALVKDFPRHLDGISNRRKESVLPSAYAVMKPFFVPDRILHNIDFLPQDHKLPQPGELLTWLAAGQTERAVDLAWASLRHAGIDLPVFPYRAPSVLGIDGERLLAALAIPIEYGQLAWLLRRIGKAPAQNEQETRMTHNTSLI